MAQHKRQCLGEQHSESMKYYRDTLKQNILFKNRVSFMKALIYMIWCEAALQKTLKMLLMMLSDVLDF